MRFLETKNLQEIDFLKGLSQHLHLSALSGLEQICKAARTIFLVWVASEVCSPALSLSLNSESCESRGSASMYLVLIKVIWFMEKH